MGSYNLSTLVINLHCVGTVWSEDLSELSPHARLGSRRGDILGFRAVGQYGEEKFAVFFRKTGYGRRRVQHVLQVFAAGLGFLGAPEVGKDVAHVGNDTEDEGKTAVVELDIGVGFEDGDGKFVILECLAKVRFWLLEKT